MHISDLFMILRHAANPALRLLWTRLRNAHISRGGWWGGNSSGEEGGNRLPISFIFPLLSILEPHHPACQHQPRQNVELSVKSKSLVASSPLTPPPPIAGDFIPQLTEKKICGSEFLPLSLATEQARVREQKSGKTTVVGSDIFMMISILHFFLPFSSVSPGGGNHRQL